ncbi:cation:H+ antiporter [Hasllibacter halocynthiae]|uniref:Cation:H+ antiporter n=1 Tax=Hasllibacter halocynthiae TaxID=595589 RepID=A0A2T0X3S1_9RHOB|nr:calcium/sodium antiporter [Hasllibacter halocynthiae]PRY93588.1 cation:H+ antiporter [Hasllibacter halocynthiae]
MPRVILDWVMVGGGLALLLVGGDFLVKGAVNLSLRLGVPALIVSLTIVAFGTSAPELLISIQAILDGVAGLALGNVVGSNTANVLLVLGVPALMTGLATSGFDTRRSYVQMLAATALFILLAFFGPFTWWHGLILLAGLAAMLLWAYRAAAAAHRAAEDHEEEVEGADPSLGWPKILGALAIGLVALPIGANLLVDGASGIARSFGFSDEVIGLTLVALGTSLPELATTISAAHRRQVDVALGNVIGSNMFNLLAIIGVASLVGPIPVDPQVLRSDLWVMAGASLVLVPFVFGRRDMGRATGGILTALYVLYVAFVLT